MAAGVLGCKRGWLGSNHAITECKEEGLAGQYTKPSWQHGKQEVSCFETKRGPPPDDLLRFTRGEIMRFRPLGNRPEVENTKRERGEALHHQ